MSGLLTRKRLLGSTAIAGAFLLAAPAFAQDTPAETPTTTDTQTGGDIVVTGSRIPHPDLESASPVTIVGALEVKQSGTTRVEDLINALPQVFAGQGGNISNGSTGTATVDLRGLGAARTLVLVNGRRLIPGDPRSPVADINMIPAAVIKRVDVLTGGASSVYGADAVSGVVNFVMDTDFDGFKIDGQYSLYNHQNRETGDVIEALNARGYGYPKGMTTDGGTVDATVVFGTGLDDGRGHITAYASYRKINAVTEDKRDYSACSLSGVTAAQSTALGRVFNCGGSGTSAPGSFYAQGTYYHVEGSNFVPGQVLFNFAPTNYFQRPDERYSAGFFAHYDVSDSFKPYLEFMFMDDRSVAQIAPSGDFFNTTNINCANPLLSAQQLAIACAAGNTFTDGQGVLRGNLYIGRRNVEGGGRRDDLQHTDYRGVFGAKGDVGKGVSYDVSYQYSRVNFAQTYRNDFSVTRLKRAIDVVNVGGVPTCRSVVDGTDPACVPYNIFQTGGVTAAALNYLQVPLFSRGQTTEQIANASLTFIGSDYGLVSPWATEGFAMNVGVEYRKESLNFEVDSNFLSGDGAGQGGPTTPVSGSFDVNEAFVEGSLPLVQDKPFFEDLRIGAGYRRSHYSIANSTNSFDTDTYKVEGNWSPVSDLKFRGSYNHAVRAPNIVELFSAQSVSLDGSIDPCAGAAPTATAAQCALTGVSAAQYGHIASNAANQYNGLQGGNPNLKPEIADSITVGVVLTPSFFKGFQATVDWFDIKLKQQIGTVGADTIITQCLATGAANLCSLVHRNAGGNLFRTSDGYIIDTNLNAGGLSTRGIDVTFGYSHTFDGIGGFGLSLAGTWIDKLVSSPVGAAATDCVGLYGSICGTPSPEWRHKLRLSYTAPFGPSLSLAWRYFSKVKTDGAGTGVRPGNAKIPAVNYFDLSFTVPVGDQFTFRLGANNILDKTPPINGQGLGVVENGNTFAQVYDSLGRYLYAGVTLDF